MRLIKIVIITSTLLFGKAANGQIVLSEIMYDPDTLEYYCEFIEIYNGSETAVDLQGWFIGTPADTDFIVPAVEGDSIILQPGMYGLILDSGYFTHGLSVYQLPDSNYLLLTIDDGGFGISGLSNSREDTVLLINSEMETVQLYQYLLNNDPGYSDEKIDFQGLNDISNWANSLSFRGTPGYKNSVSIADFNIKIEKLEIINGRCRVKVLNNGLNSIAQNIVFQLYVDLDFNNEFNQNDSLIIENEFFIELESNDSILIELDGDLNFYGNWYSRVTANISDENPADNSSSGYLDFPILSGALVINELMISPSEYGEWIEIYNSTSNIISLQNLQLLDSRDTVWLENIFLLPEQYLILCQKEEWVDYLISSGVSACEISWLTLNNTTDFFSLIDSYNNVIDEAYYEIDEMNIELVAGYSLERIKPNYTGRDIWNWALSVNSASHTAGAENSVYFKKVNKKQKLSISPNPFSPDGDGFEDVCQLALQTNFEIMDAAVKIFSLDGNMVKKWNLKQIPGDYTLIWDGRDKNGAKQPLGLYIIYVEMINRQNGKKIKDKKSLVLAYKK